MGEASEAEAEAAAEAAAEADTSSPIDERPVPRISTGSFGPVAAVRRWSADDGYAACPVGRSRTSCLRYRPHTSHRGVKALVTSTPGIR